MIKNTLYKAIDAGANELKRYFNGTFTISSKATINDLVTEADHASEKAIFEVIQQNHDYRRRTDRRLYRSCHKA